MESIVRRNPLPGVPAIESPFFDDVFVPEHFSDQELAIARQLRDKGYAVFDFPDADIQVRAEQIKTALHGRYPWSKWSTGDADMRILDAWKFDANVRAIATNQSVLELLSKLYGRQAWPFQTLNFPVGTQQHFHTDSIHFSSVPERFMCGVWLALEDIGPDQGPLEYYAGSHRWPIYTNEHVGHVPRRKELDQSVYHELWERLVDKTGVPRETFHPRKGQALIWTSNLLHGGSRHLDKSKTRWSQVTHYYFEDCAYYQPIHSDPFRGLIRFKQPIDLRTLQRTVPAFSGRRVPRRFLAAAKLGFEPFAKLDGFRHRLVKDLGRLRSKLMNRLPATRGMEQ
jgi:ectoine hydroxylase-related dioxygenase (phytanoyl-CoA dioxygenase family)